MRLTTYSEYGLLALLYICRSKEEGYIPLQKIAKEQKMPLKYLEHLMQTLCRNGYLTSRRGKNGGYRLNRPADQVTVAEIVRLFDGPLAATESVSEYFYKSTPIEKEKKLLGLFRDIRDYTAKKLEGTSLAEVA